jgi:hypothetical protein
LNHGFVKLSDYYTKIDESPYYAAAVALHPCKKFAYFDTTWGPTKGGRDAIKTAKQSTRRLFKQYLNRAHSFECEGLSPTPLRTLIVDDKSEDEDEDWTNAFGDYTAVTERSRLARQRQESELDRFMNDHLDTHYRDWIDGKAIDVSYNGEPLRWWRERGQGSYPLLATIVFDLLTMPGMSAECERVFSSAKRMIPDERYSLKCDIIEADQCVKSWFKYGIADGQKAFSTIADESVDSEAV